MQPVSGSGWREHTGQMSDEQIKRNLADGAAVRAMWDNTAPPAGSEGGYEWDPLLLDEIIHECERLREDLDKDEPRYEQLATARPIAPDQHASVPVSDAVREFGKQQLRRNEEWRRFLGDYVEKLKQTRNSYEGQEQQAGADITDANRDLA